MQGDQLPPAPAAMTPCPPAIMDCIITVIRIKHKKLMKLISKYFLHFSRLNHTDVSLHQYETGLGFFFVLVGFFFLFGLFVFLGVGSEGRVLRDSNWPGL